MRLYIDINTSKKRGYKVILYYIKGNLISNKYLKANIKLILFLSKLLNRVKTYY